MKKTNGAAKYDLSSDWTSAMIWCRCGDVFQASGTPEAVSAKQAEWERQHRACIEPIREGRKVFWLSFCDGDRPQGQQFLGCCLIEVTAAEADEAAIDILPNFPFAQPHAEWLGAAVKKAHQLGCNPGGEVASMEVPEGNPLLKHYPFGVLMDKATVERLDDEIERARG